MKLRERTQRKFMDFFEKAARMHQGEPFELAYSDIQRETGTASVTLKRAIEALINDQVLEVEPGRNSRYGRFNYLPYQKDNGEEVLPNADFSQTGSIQEAEELEDLSLIEEEKDQEVKEENDQEAKEAQGQELAEPAENQADGQENSEVKGKAHSGAKGKPNSGAKGKAHSKAKGKAHSEVEQEEVLPSASQPQNFSQREETLTVEEPTNDLVSVQADIEELTHLTSHLWRRVRHQEMTITLLQDRLAELEDKLYKR